MRKDDFRSQLRPAHMRTVFTGNLFPHLRFSCLLWTQAVPAIVALRIIISVSGSFGKHILPSPEHAVKPFRHFQINRLSEDSRSLIRIVILRFLRHIQKCFALRAGNVRLLQKRPKLLIFFLQIPDKLSERIKVIGFDVHSGSFLRASPSPIT